jgi:hypothetical protein
MPEAFTGKEVSVYFMPMTTYNGLSGGVTWSTHGSVINATTMSKSFELSGGNIETEEEPFFGGAMLTFRTARQPFELSFEVRIPTGSTNKNMWETMNFGSGLTSATNGDSYVIGFKAVDTDQNPSETKSIEFKNAIMTQFEPSFEADSYWQANVTFKIAPTTSAGDANVTFNNPTFVK